jgi:pSer/pThr/pTyr-binding forkhead associated (FHA) protein
MVPSVTLTVLSGNLAGKRYHFTKPTRCTMGRGEDCDIQLAFDVTYMDISRRQCQLEIDPPGARVRDLASLNGTYVNGRKIGQRERAQGAAAAQSATFPDVPLQDGDELQLGHRTILLVSILPSEQRERMPVRSRERKAQPQRVAAMGS